MSDEEIDNKIAIVGMAGRFPGASSVDELWQLILSGRDAIRAFDDGPQDEFDETTGAYGVVDDTTQFDHKFFGMSPAAARRTDPQHRTFMECAWTALEHAGVDVGAFPGYVAVYASSGTNPYYQRRVFDLADVEDWAGKLDLTLKSAKDHLATRVAYRLNLNGEAMTVQCACSSSLVAVHLACQSLLIGQCDLAIAGASSLRASPEVERGVVDPMQRAVTRCKTGRNGAFTTGGGGVGGDAVAAVVLKPLRAAIEDGNTIYAVVAGSALNNDGNRKVGYTAPSVDGIEAVMQDALAFAGLYPEEIGYVECHGTGTELGDAMELRALRRVFEVPERGDEPLHLGAVKNNVGHTDAAAGIVSLIKAALVLHHGVIPPHGGEGEPHSQVVESPVLSLSEERRPWSSERPRLASVNAFAIGGTNAHMILHEAPESTPAERQTRPASLLVWSAKTEEALQEATARLASALGDSSAHLHDIERTLQTGRTSLDQRRYAVVTDLASASEAVRNATPVEVAGGKTAFVFGGRPQRPAPWVVALRATSAAFDQALLSCETTAREVLGLDLATWMTSPTDDEVASVAAHVALQFSLAEMYQSYGFVADAVHGWGVGEIVAACIAGALSVDDMLRAAAGQLSGLEIGKLDVPLLGTDGQWVDAAALSTAGRWQFADVSASNEAISALKQAGASLLLSLEPSAVVTEGTVAAISEEGWRRVCGVVGHAWCSGVKVDWSAFAPTGAVADLPTYSFQRSSSHIDDEYRRFVRP